MAAAAVLLIGGFLIAFALSGAVKKPEVTRVEATMSGGVLRLVVDFRVEEIPPGGKVGIEAGPSESFEKPWRREWLEDPSFGRTLLQVRIPPVSRGWVRLLVQDDQRESVARSEPFGFEVSGDAP